MTAKEYLSQAYHLDKRIDSKIEQLKSLNLLATKCTSTLSDMPKSQSISNSRLEDTVVKIVDLQEEINRDIDRLVDLKRDIVRAIKKVKKASFFTKVQEEKANTLVATDYKDPPIVNDNSSYGFYPQMKAECITFTKEKSGCIVNGTNPGFQNGVLESSYIVRRLTPTECARLAGLLKCENVQGKEHLLKGGKYNGNKKGYGYSAHNKSADKNFKYNGQEKTNSRLCSCFD